jgi:ketosteroid isomerase-like protein
MKTSVAMSRRYLLAGGASSLAVACAGAHGAVSSVAATAAPSTPHRQEMIRNWYGAWEKKDWGALDSLAADDFTFSSAAGDDHISKSKFKAQCWDTQSALIDRFELESVLDNGSEAFVKYVCRTKKGKAFRNVEHFTFAGEKVAALECYFGEQVGYPGAADSAKG